MPRSTVPSSRHVSVRRALVGSFAAIVLLAATLVETTVPASGAQSVFQDGFETGIVPPWSASANLTVDTTTVHSGTQAARTTSSVAWAEEQLATPVSDLDLSFWFNVASRSTTVWLGRVRTASGTPLVRLYLTAKGALAYRNEIGNVNRVGKVKITSAGWHQLDLHALIDPAGSVSVSLDGTAVPGLSAAEALGSTPAGRFEIGNRQLNRSYTIVYDDVQMVDNGPVVPAVTPPVSLAASDVGGDRVTLGWAAPSSGSAPTGYGIYRDNVRIGTVPGDTTTYTDLNVGDHDAYAYAVTSEGSGGESGPSNFVPVRMPGFDPATDAVVLAAGDVACPSATAVSPTTCQQAVTADILQQQPADAILVLGDEQYPAGAYTDFMTGYDPTWGRPGLLSMTHPVPGNHEYKTAGAAGYFQYFGPTPSGTPEGDSSFDVAGWHLIGLNSNCSQVTVGGCAPGTAQYTWLQSDLAASTASCTIAYWHHPRWSSGVHGSLTQTDPFWGLLYGAGAELVLAGHDHSYERFAPIGLSTGTTPTLDPAGIRSFVVGTGGRDQYAAGAPILGSEAIAGNLFGVLKLTLHAGSYDWRFVPQWGTSYTDSGSGTCH